MMKKLIYLGALALTLPVNAQVVDRSKAPDPAKARKIEMGKYESFTLENGLKVFVVTNHKLPRVSWQLSFDLPPIKEGDKSGTSDLVGEMMEAGTTNRSKIQLNEELDFLGASLNVSASGIYASSLTKHAPKLLDLMSDVLFNPAFPEEEFKKLKVKKNSELLAAKNSPSEISQRAGNVIRNGDHPYGEIMTEASLESIELADVSNFYKTWFKPNVAYLAIVGDITVDQAKELVNKHFADWKKGRLPVATYPAPVAPAETMVAFVDRPGAVQSVINIHFPIDLKPGTPDALAASVMNTMLGGSGFSGRLMKNIREDKAYAYGSYSRTVSDRHAGYFVAFAEVRNEVTDSAIVQMLYEIERIAKTKPDADELQIILNEMSGGFGRSLESPQTLARFALDVARYNLPADYYDTYLERLNAITPEDVQQIAQQLLNTNRAIVQVVGNHDAVSEKLKVFSPDGKVNHFDFNGKKVVEMKPVPAGITAEVVLRNYINAIGGEKRLAKVKTFSQISELDIPGMPAKITMEIHKQGETRMVMDVKMAAASMQKNVVSNGKGFKSGMGGKGEMSKEEIDAMKDQMGLVPERNLLKQGLKDITVAGIEQVNGVDAYKLEMVKDDTKSVTYYDVNTGLKIRSLTITTSTSADGKSKTDVAASDILEYMEVNGMKFPKISTIDMAGQTLKALTTDIQINPKFPKDKFALK
jgi:zinc protease